MLFHELRLSGFLSFGPEGVALPMKPLNVLIGPNSSGKSNFLETISLFRDAPREIAEPISRNGGLREWKWKGSGTTGSIAIEALMDVPGVGAARHRIEFGEAGGSVVVVKEAIKSTAGRGQKSFFRPPRTAQVAREIAEYNKSWTGEKGDHGRVVSRESSDAVEYLADFRPGESILRYATTPDHPLLWNLKGQYDSIHMYRNWAFGPNAGVRVPTSAHGRSDFVEEGAENLALVLSHLSGERKTRFLEAAGKLFDGIVDVLCPVTGGVVSLLLEESGGRTIPASRLSDGTLRYLSLLAILLHPEPPSVICIEEPELGLHPDLLPTLCSLMREASKHSQLVVTTHSDILVDALTEDPESIVVCEKEDGRTTMRRLNRENLDKWLEKYRLGELWISGELGGNRW